MVDHPDPFQLLKPSTIIQFAYSGERQVVGTQGKQVSASRFCSAYNYSDVKPCLERVFENLSQL